MPSSVAALEGAADLVGPVAELGQRGPDLAARLGGTRRARRARRRRRTGQLEARAQVEDEARRGLAADTGHRAQRAEVLVEHGPHQVGGTQGAQDGEGQGRTDAVGAEQRLEAAPLLGGGEAVEHDGVLADVGVHVQLDGRAPVAHRGQQRRRHREAVADATHVDDELAFGAAT